MWAANPSLPSESCTTKQLLYVDIWWSLNFIIVTFLGTWNIFLQFLHLHEAVLLLQDLICVFLLINHPRFFVNPQEWKKMLFCTKAHTEDAVSSCYYDNKPMRYTRMCHCGSADVLEQCYSTPTIRLNIKLAIMLALTIYKLCSFCHKHWRKTHIFTSEDDILSRESNEISLPEKKITKTSQKVLICVGRI